MDEEDEHTMASRQSLLFVWAYIYDTSHVSSSLQLPFVQIQYLLQQLLEMVWWVKDGQKDWAKYG